MNGQCSQVLGCAFINLILNFISDRSHRFHSIKGEASMKENNGDPDTLHLQIFIFSNI